MLRFILTTLVLVIAACMLPAAELQKTPVQYLIPKAKAPIAIDGSLQEWEMAKTPYIISPTGKEPVNKVMSNDPTNPVKGDADFSGRVALAWDDTFLYVAADMTDDQLLGVKPDSFGNQGPPGWGCDSLMVSIASFRQPLKTNSPFSNVPFLGLRYAPAGPNPRGKLVDGGPAVLDKRDLYWVLTEGSKWKVMETAKGYAVEAAIPWSDLQFTPRVGERLFIAFLGADVDPGEALNQVGWNFIGDPRSHPIFRLADRDDTLGVITLSQDVVPSDTAWTARVELDARTAPAKLTGLRVADEKGKAVLTEALAVEVPAGMTAVEMREFRAGAVAKPGRYVLEALAGNSVVARQPFQVVEPAPPAPQIKNLPGEIHHMGPDRIAHNAYMEHREGLYRHGFVKGKDDYVPFIRKHVEPGLKSTVRNNIATKSVWGYSYALQCIAMFRITGDQEYVTLARDTMDYYLDLYAAYKSQGELLWGRLSSLTMYRYLTWKTDLNSPFAPKDAEKRYRAVMYSVAANPSKDLFDESGTHNRVWQRYSIQKIARMVAEEDGKPVDPRIIDYTNYHDKLIGEVGDSDDASAGYHWVFFDAAVSILFHTGDWEAFKKHPGYLKTLYRYVEMVSPSGAVPPFASCSGWPEVGASMWVYEMLSTITRDGRFRYASHRIAEYYYNHLDARANQYHGPYDTARNNFALAYLFADETVAPTPPRADSRVTWRHPLAPVSLERMKARPGTWMWEIDGQHWIPDKIVLSSGNDPQAMWGLVELLPMAGHGGELPGNIIALTVHDAALFAGQGYYENSPDFQNLMWIEDLDGLAADPRPLATDVPIFTEDSAFTFARIRTTAYQHMPVTYTRDLLFYKNGFLVVKDRVKFDTSMKVRLGPCYYARDLGPESGANWFNAYYDQLYYTGLGLGRGVQAIRNPSWDLMIYFTPRAGRDHTVVDRYLENPYRNSPVQLRQTWAGMARAGQEVTFTSVLLPHAPLVNPSALLDPPADTKDPKRIEVIRDDDAVTVVKVISEMDPVNKIRYETWIMLNETGKPVTAGPLESDARLAVIGLNYDGTVLNRAITGGTILRFKGVDETAKARKQEAAPLPVPAEFWGK